MARLGAIMGGFSLLATAASVGFVQYGDELRGVAKAAGVPHRPGVVQHEAAVLATVALDGRDVLDGFTLTGVSREDFTLHFAEATTVTLSNLRVSGTVLAPLAAVSLTSGRIEGSVYAASLDVQKARIRSDVSSGSFCE